MNSAAIEKLVRERIGLEVASIGAASLARAIEGRMKFHGVNSVEAYANLAAGDAGEWSALVGELVVPESWFFRGGAELYDYLSNWLRRRLNDSLNGRILRVLSVPCSTGEEPYSLAIVLDRDGVPAARCQIDGVDMARDHLLRAVAARYSAFSFREPGLDPRPKYFHEVEDGKWEVRREYSNRVRFRPGNLVDPAFLATEAPYDLILCRNLFIYLTAEGRTRALANLERLLAADGRLCLTPAEADRLPAARFAADGPVSLAIFKRGKSSGTLAVPTPRSGSISVPVAPVLAGKTPALPAKSAAVPAKTCDPLIEGRLLADAGKLDDARRVCEGVLETPSADLFSLLGVIHLAAGRSNDAAEAFRKALYLDPAHGEALTHMMMLCDQRGDRDQAEGLRRRLDRLATGVAS